MPWQIKSILVIDFSPYEMPYNAVFWGIMRLKFIVTLSSQIKPVFQEYSISTPSKVVKSSIAKLCESG